MNFDTWPLLKRAQAGDMQAFAELFEPLRARMHAVAFRLVGPDQADDAVMDTYLRAWKALPAFDGRSAIATWLCRIVHNRCVDLLRTKRPILFTDQAPENTENEGDQEEQADLKNPAPDEWAMRRETAAQIDRALERLSLEHRATLLLRYVDGLSYEELAAATGVSLGTVMSRLFNAKRKLKSALEVETASNAGDYMS